MHIVSVNIGLPNGLVWRGTRLVTAIFKQPVRGPLAVRWLNLDGDRQADLSVHGGKDKAIYGYPLEHYDYWRSELGRGDLSMGIFGENLTLDEVSEDSVQLGDRYSVGSAELVVTQPRLPCYKLGMRFEDDQMVGRLLASGRTGFYFGVGREGQVASGDEVKLITRDPQGITVADLLRLYTSRTYGRDQAASAHRALGIAALPERWKQRLRERLEKLPTRSEGAGLVTLSRPKDMTAA